MNKIVYKIKSLLYPLMPLCYYNYREKKRSNNSNSFLGGYEKYKSSIRESNAKLKRNYKQVVDVLGFGYSGSGAIVDLFSECDNCFVVGHSEDNTYYNVDVPIGFETDFVRLSGGLLEIDKYVGSNNYFHNDALLNRFVKCVEDFPPFKEDDNVRRCFFEFFDEIVDFKMLRIEGNPYNSYLYPQKNMSCIFFLKEMTLVQYRLIASKFLEDLFTVLNKKKASFLVFDHILGDGEMDKKKNDEYIRGVKTIIVYRDPRDIYTFAVKKNLSWIAHNNVDDFIIWFKIMTRRFNLQDKTQLVVQFEKLVTEYDKETVRIFNYVGLDIKKHNLEKKYRYFNPNYSIKNVGIWKSSNLPKSDFEKISRSLSAFCFE